jgi:hypothetical protein
MVLMLVSASFVGISHKSDESSTELIIEGPTTGVVGEPLEYTFILIDPGEGNFSYYIDWDDDTSTGWIGPYPPEKLYLTHVWNESGLYTIRAKARDAYHQESYDAILNVTIIDNQPPDRPKITGPWIEVIPYECKIRGIDPDGDNVSYQIDWDDGDISDWTTWYLSGEEITRNHTYNEQGDFQIKARAKDIHGAIGEWGVIVKSKQVINLPFLQFLQRVLQFPLLSWLLDSLKDWRSG